jgi:hypothetical protein
MGSRVACFLALCLAAIPSSGAGPAAARDTIVNPAVVSAERDGVPVYRKRILSSVYTIDRIYRSMMGPQSSTQFSLLEGEPELIWIVGYATAMAGPDGTAPASAEFMCHSNLNVDAAQHSRSFPTRIKLRGGRLFTVSQGQLEIDLPHGFGIPMMSDHTLSLFTQVLNLNHEGERIEVRHDVRVDFIRDRDLPQPLIPLIESAVWGMKLVAGIDGYYGMISGKADPGAHGPGCMIGPAVESPAEDEHIFEDGVGRLFTGHWQVQPGREENHTLVTRPLLLPYDTTIHHIAVHLHPFAESLELRDLTTGRTVYKSTTRQAEHGIGLAEVKYFSSVEGLPLYRDHEYELVSIYNNTSDEVQDSMATMLLFLHARDLTPDILRPGAADTPAGASPGAAHGPKAEPRSGDR